MNHYPFSGPDESAPAYKIFMALYKAKDAISRAEDNLAEAQLEPSACAYIDTQLAKAIGYLASARAVAVEQGGMSELVCDNGEVWDLDDEVVLAKSAELVSRSKGGVS